MLKELKTMLNSNPLDRVRVLQDAERNAYKAGYEKGRADGLSEGKGLHDGNCHQINNRFFFHYPNPKESVSNREKMCVECDKEHSEDITCQEAGAKRLNV